VKLRLTQEGLKFEESLGGSEGESENYNTLYELTEDPENKDPDLRTTELNQELKTQFYRNWPFYSEVV